ncbi:MAG: aspartate--tRNA ligase [Candidatus Wildermuthbacteria bacterium]|nr:aspartate--tRNA ligase [Candidatus Wildermuthbacteria bacterium]
MERTLTNELTTKKGEEVKIAGWVDTRRNHGKIIFIDLRDRGGAVQVVFTPDAKNAYDAVAPVRSEWVLEIEGTVQERPENMKNPNSPTGNIEISAENIFILSQAKTLPFAIDTDGHEIGEEHRLKYRYVDLRRKRLQQNIKARNEAIYFIREFLRKKDFIEIETPIITKSTPEGARDYVVPSRLYAGKFYALPQSPQQYKQLLQIAGFERYFQIARCFRDEDPRADRQPEFTQLDIEMSFVAREDIMAVTEELLLLLVKTLYPQKKVQETPFPRIFYKDAMEQYGTDRPDIRKDKNDKDLLAFCWVIDFPFFSVEGGSASGGEKETSWTFTHNPFSAPKPEFMEDLMAKRNIGNILTSQYDIVLNGLEIGGGSIRNHQPEALEKVFEIMGFEKERIVANFGHMLEAFSFGAPPHGGIAWGFERLLMLLRGEQSIREVIAFPKTGDSRDLMMESPSEISQEQLKELHLSIEKIKNKK